MKYDGSLSHAYIISGDAESAFAEAKTLAAAMLCTAPAGKPCGMCRNCAKAKKDIHPDILFVERQVDDKGKLKRDIAVDQIREIAESAIVLPNEADRKVYILREGGLMNANAQNAFLKLLEEPPRFVSFILCCENAGQLLETVRSRCVSIPLQTGAGEFSPQAREFSEKYMAACAKKNPLALLSLLNANSDISPAEAAEYIGSNLLMLTDMLCGRLSGLHMERRELLRLAHLMERAQEYLRSNVSVKHLFGMLSADSIEL